METERNEKVEENRIQQHTHTKNELVTITYEVENEVEVEVEEGKKCLRRFSQLGLFRNISHSLARIPYTHAECVPKIYINSE